ncbi:MAG: hypothetical protein J1F32_04665 [Erysipelotrichales bacterium]|nr:hypothetical protein [Erysipelotrichales bacterium]
MSKKDRIFVLYCIITVLGGLFLATSYISADTRSSSEIPLLPIVGLIMFIGGLIMLILTTYLNGKDEK